MAQQTEQRAVINGQNYVHIPPELLDLSSPSCSDRIAARESNLQWKFTHLDELWADPETLRRHGATA
jgi:hypothetical protein